MNKDMVIMIAVIVLEVCTGCAPKGPAPQYQVSGFETQISAFEQASIDQDQPIVVTDLVIELSADIGSSGEDGVCIQGTNQTPVIQINATFWANASDQGKEALVFHELGHCILQRSHVKVVDNNYVPASIMFPCASVYNDTAGQGNVTCNGIHTNVELDVMSYQANRNVYINELFNQ